MGTIIDSQNLHKLRDRKKAGHKLILTGGSFDILHTGHIEFLRRAKDLGDELLVLLEPDEKIRKIKGENRPVNTQKDRAIILSNLPMVSYVHPLKNSGSNEDYEILVKTIQPDIIALTESDSVFEWEKALENQGILKIVKVMHRIPNHSTTQLITQNKHKL